MRPDLLADLAATYTGLTAGETWQALFATIALMRKAATEVGDRLGYPYPQDIERRMMDYLTAVRNLIP